ncbi:MAG TPA: insulinase family protein [Polyangiaceae bacterium]|jgi:zinc protease|nr:insulinase family protein [Polyangiaceae bacterium]
MNRVVVLGFLSMLARCAAVLALLAASAPAHASETSDADQALDAILRRLPRPEPYTLQSGLQVVIQPVPWQSQVAVAVAYGVGARDDPSERRGLAHLVEHMTYRGSRHLPAYGAMPLVDGSGGQLFGGTHFDWTLYAELVPALDLPRALWLESERLAFTLEQFSEDSLYVEKRTVAQEMRLRDGVVTRFDMLVERALFGEQSPYARQPDYSRFLQTFDLSDVRTFFRRNYRPDNGVLVVTGGVDSKVVREEVETYFGPVRNQARSSPVSPTGLRSWTMV